MIGELTTIIIHVPVIDLDFRSGHLSIYVLVLGYCFDTQPLLTSAILPC
jgi:hypothetical protein